MRAITLIPVLAIVLALAAPAAQGQSEDEQILQSDPAAKDQEAPPEEPKKQHPEDDEIDDEDLDEQVFYSGMGLERVSTDYENLGAATNLTAVLGFRIPTAKWFGLEIDLGQTLIPGENNREVDSSAGCGGLLEPPCEDNTADRDELGMQALGLSLALKTTGRFYLMGRYGYRYLATSIDELNEDRSSKGLGVGLGYRWGRGLSGVEFAYKQIGEDVDSLGLTFYVRSMRR
jgi:hypothetical protein